MNENMEMKSFDNAWEEIHASQDWGKYPGEPVIRFIARNYYKKDRKKIKILDFGCGAGANTWYLAREGFDTYAFDGSKSAIRKTEARLKEEELSADLRVRDALELDYKPGTFDCIIDNAVVYANRRADIARMYGEIYWLLKPDGKLFSTSFTTGTTGFGTGTKLEQNTFRNITEGSLAGRGTVHFFEEEELRSILVTAGFHNVIVDSLRFTDGRTATGQVNVIEQFLVQAEK